MRVSKLFRRIFTTFLLAFPGVATADAVALVIGNDSYEHVSKLEMARADARGYAAMFEARGFKVFVAEDADGTGMRLALAQFYDAIAPGDTVAFVYAGHGWSNGTNNFLLPTDVSASGSQSLITAQSFDLRNGVNGIIDEIHRRGPGFTLAVIDACRDNPFRDGTGTRSVGLARGLTPVSAPTGTFIAFSAGEGQTALDRLGDGENERFSVFSRHFLEQLSKPQDVQSAFKATQLAVNRDAQSVGHRQRPAYYDEVIGEVCLPPGCKAEPVVPPVPETPADTVRRADPDAAQEWQDFKDSNSVSALRLFAERHQGTAYAALANERIAALSGSAVSNEPDVPKTVEQASDLDFPRPDWCQFAKTKSERAICKDAVLSRLDIRLNQAYDRRRNLMSNSLRRKLSARQDRWLKRRDACGARKPCLIAAYEDALERLE